MAIADRIADRIEHDLTGTEINAMITEAVAAIESRYGTVGVPITVTLEGARRRLDFPRPIDSAQTIAVTERDMWGDPTAVASTDYAIRNGGRTLERLGDRLCWDRTVTVVYTPVSDQAQRDEVTIGLVQLAIERMGVAKRKVGDVDTQAVDYVAEREKLLGSLAPRRGMLLA